MKHLVGVAAAAVAACGFFFAPCAVAHADVLKSKGCLGCHDLEKKKAGPPFKEVAAKKQGQSAELVAKIRDAKGHPKVNASEADIRAAVEQVLASK